MLHFVSEINILAITLTENVGVIFCYGDEENARIYAVHLTTANQSEIRRAHLVSVFANFQIQKSHPVGCKTLILCLFNSLLWGKMVE